MCGVVWEEVAATTSKHQVDYTTERVCLANHLHGNIVLHLSPPDVTRKDSRRRIRDPSRNDKTSSVSHSLRGLHDTAARLEARQNGDGTIVALLSAAERGRTSSTVGHKRARTACPALPDQVLVDCQSMVERELVDML